MTRTRILPKIGAALAAAVMAVGLASPAMAAGHRKTTHVTIVMTGTRSTDYDWMHNSASSHAHKHWGGTVYRYYSFHPSYWGYHYYSAMVSNDDYYRGSVRCKIYVNGHLKRNHVGRGGMSMASCDISFDN